MSKMNPEDQIPDLYKLPPMEFQSYDEWKKDSGDESTVQTVDIPEPDYLDQEESGGNPNGDSRPRSPSYSSSIFTMPPADTNGAVIEPRRLENPCLESKERQNLHKELLLNQKLGIDVLHQKSELRKELERRKNIVKKKELEEYQRNKRTSLEVKLEEQANKLKEVDKPESKPIPEEKEAPEFLKVHSKINRAKLES